MPEVRDWMANVMEPTAFQALLRVLHWLASQQLPLAEVWLFGSQARATVTQSSDVDILVVLLGNDAVPLKQAIRESQVELAAAISGQLGELVQIQYIPLLEWLDQSTPLARNAFRDGIRLQ